MSEKSETKVKEVKEKNTRAEKARAMMLSLTSKLWILFRVNILFIIFCIPVATAPAAASAMTKVLMNIVRKDDCDIWSDFIGEFKVSFIKSLGAGITITLLLSAVFAAGYGIMVSFSGFAGAVGTALIIVFGIYIYMSACYLFPLIVTVDLGLKQCLRNSFLLSLIEIKHNLLLLIPLALLISCVLLFPVSLPLFLFILFALCQYVACIAVNEVIQKRIIDPYHA